MTTQTHRRSGSWVLRSAIAAATMFAGAQAQAQTPQLEEVIVTAQKRAENIQDVPVSITALKGEEMQSIRAGGQDIRFLNGRAPSLIVESDFGRIFPRFYIRGIGNTDFDQNASQPVSLIYDGVVYENPMLKGFPVFDTERVEILRGPQGTLFGRNTPAGTVQLTSVRPSQETEGYMKLGLGNLGSTDFEAAIGGALTDRWSARASVLRQTRDDWVANKPSEVDSNLAYLDDDSFLEGYTETAYRVQALYEGDKVTAYFNVHGRDLDGTATLFRANILEKGSNDFVDSYDREVVHFDGHNEQEAKSTGGVAQFDIELGDYTLTTVTGYEQVETYSRADVEGGIGAVFMPIMGPTDNGEIIPFPAHTADGIPDHSQFTQEVRISSNNEDGFNWQAGVYYFDEHLEVDSFNYGNWVPADGFNGNLAAFEAANRMPRDQFNGWAHQEQDTKAWAVFGQVNWDLNDRTTVTAGLRYSDDQKDYFAERTVTNHAPWLPAVLDPIPVSVGDSQFSGDLAINYALSENSSLYSRLARGFRAPSIQGRVLFADTVTVADSETVVSWDFGYKSELLDNTMRFNAAVYAYQINDQQLTAGSGEANANQLVNADKVDGAGVEVDVEWLASDNLMITWGGSYNHTEIKDPNLSILPCGANCTVLDPAGSFAGSVSIDGNPLPRSPKVISNLAARYTVPMQSGEMYFYGDWSYRSKINFFLYESAEFRGDSMSLVGLRAGYIGGEGDYELAAYVRNATDEDQVIAAIDFNNLEGIVNDPRTYGVELLYRF